MIEEILKKLEKSIESSGNTKKFYYEGLGMSGTGFSQSIERKTITLNNFIKLCELLNLQPSTFFLENKGNINNAMHSPNTNQSINSNERETNLLREENKFLREKIEWLESRLKNDKL